MIITLSNRKRGKDVMPLEVNILGYNHKQETIDRPRGMSLYQWFYCERGSGALTVDDQRMVIREKQGFLLHPHVTHTYRPLSDDWTVHFVGFKGPMCATLLMQLGMYDSGAYYFSDPDFFRDRIADMFHLYMRDRQDHNGIAAACFHLLLGLSERISQVEHIGTYNANPIVDRAISAIERRYMEPLSIEDIAAEAGVSNEYLCSLFKKTVGQTVHHFLTITRIVNARLQLLQFPDRPIADIATDCGFRSASHFCSVFRKHSGSTPAKYRQTANISDLHN